MNQLEEEIKGLGQWFHNINLGGIQTAPDHFLGDYPNIKFQSFAHALPADLTGKTVLDIGCNAGFYAIEMKRRGADRVLGIDSDDRYLNQGRFAAKTLGFDIEFRDLSVYDVGALKEQFDVVIFMGVLYHLRHPLLALDLLHEHVVKDMLLFQSLQRGSTTVDSLKDDYDFWEMDIFNSPGYPKMHFIEKNYSNDPTNWWAPNAACIEAMLRSAGFTIAQQPEQGVYICHKAELIDKQPRAVYPAR